jgi:hypothetical protein
MISYMISPLPSTCNHAAALAGADISPAIRTDHDSDSQADRVMDTNEEWDFADQDPPSDYELQILAALLKHIPACIDAADIDLLLQTFQCSRLWWFLPGLCRRQYRQMICHHWTWMLLTSSPRANTFFKSTSVNTIPTQLNWKILYNRVLHHPDFNLYSVGMWALQWKTQGKMLSFNLSGHRFRAGGGTSIWGTFYVQTSQLVWRGVKPWGPATRFSLKWGQHTIGLTKLPFLGVFFRLKQSFNRDTY